MEVLVFLVCLILLPIAIMALAAALPFILAVAAAIFIFVASQPSAEDPGAVCVIVPDTRYPELSLKKCTDEEGNVFYEANSE